MYAQVVFSKVSSFTDKEYSYSITEALEPRVKIGAQVLVPFGKRKAVGYVVGLSEAVPEEVKFIKPIFDVMSDVPLFTEDSVKLARWISKYYITFFGSALRLMLPPGKGIIAGCRDTQNKSISQGYSTTLIFGPSGSGKTQTYIERTRDVVALGEKIVILVPEMTGEHYVVDRFKAEFGDIVSILHSHMTDKERMKEWTRIFSGEAKVVIGTRSALFAPVNNLGLVIIDQEEEFTYKSEQSPKYHAREVAQMICKIKNIPLILGSGCPSVETYHKSKTGEYLLIKLEAKSAGSSEIKIVDMKNSRAGALSNEMVENIKDTLDKKEKVVLLVNRRGYAPHLVCNECGKVVECPNCSVSLAYHSPDKNLVCHKCGFKREVPLVCPKCMSTLIRFLGTGTQKIESEIAKHFEDIKIIRIDKDSINKKGMYDTAIKTFIEGGADILIGTQMVIKALEQAETGLVGILSADAALNNPDFKSSESTYEMISEICGTSKRIKPAKKVVIQTYNPDHYAISNAASGDYEGFYENEISNRHQGVYPPFTKIINIVLLGSLAPVVGKYASEIAKKLEELTTAAEIMGPVQTAVTKVRGMSRWQILIKGTDLDIIKQELGRIMHKTPKNIRLSIDVDPISIF